MCGDCLDILNQFPAECIDLIYIDPPFFTQKQYEVIWGNHLEVREWSDRWILNTNKDRAVKSINVYLEWCEPRLKACHRVLKSTGSFYLHCDYHANAHLRILLDKIFGENNFQNEIIWFYRTGGASRDKFARKHDNIYFYTKGKDYTFNPQKEKSYMMHKYGFKKIKVAVQEDEKGQYTLVFARDVWEIPSVGSHTSERLGYPTQKPEVLLERIIKASSNPGDIVLDPMVGGGTAIAVAKKLGRKWIGIDVSPIACRISVERVGQNKWNIVGYSPLFEELNRLKPIAFQNWLICRMGGIPNPQTVGDLGIDGTIGNIPVQVKKSRNVGRQVIDLFETALRREGKKCGKIIAYSFTTDAISEVARAKREEGLNIELITLKELKHLNVIREKTEKEIELEKKRKTKLLNDFTEVEED